MDTTVIAWLVTGLCALFNLAVTTTLTILIKRWFDKRDAENKKRAAEKEQLAALKAAEEKRNMEAAMDDRCNKQVCALNDGLNAVNEMLEVLHNGAQAGLRDDILNCYWRCHDWQKFRTGWDTENMEDLYKAYQKLHGNSFIDNLMKEFYKIPLQ